VRAAAASLLLRTSVVRQSRQPSWLKDTQGAARRAELSYVSCAGRGIHRVRRGKGFRYVHADGSPVTGRAVLERIGSLAIPPAWTDVWICPHASGHLQATGRDARGRKQYRYHPRWRVVRDEAKYLDMLAFARALPRLRRRVSRDLASSRLTRDKVVAAVIRIMERTAVRVGNDSYAEANGSYGLTTLEDRHARISGPRLELRFRGKSKQPQHARLDDARLARIVKRCRDLPGQRLFQYRSEDGRLRTISSSDVNRYLKAATGGDFTSKTFRTWAATVFATTLLTREPPPESERASKKTVSRVIEQVAAQLGNTPAVCRKSYVHPAVVTAFSAGALPARTAKTPRRALGKDESLVLSLLERRAPGRAA
jgi:DNA topoisomerase-1